MQKSEVNFAHLGISFLTSLNQQLLKKYSICLVFLALRHKLYLCILQLGISVLMSLDLGLLKNIAV